MKNIFELQIFQKIFNFLKKILKKTHWYYIRVRSKGAEVYSNPTVWELQQIEHQLAAKGVLVNDYTENEIAFTDFNQILPFSKKYREGINAEIWDEKRLEHFISFSLLGLKNFSNEDIYLDVAAGQSPWAKLLREDLGIQAYALDQKINSDFKHIDFYMKENAIQTNFPDSSVRGISLHCAYEMFYGNDDMDFIQEAGRILRPGGKVVILPLYMHTHYCSYSTAEYWGRKSLEPGMKEYVRLDCYGIDFSRKYDAKKLKNRILDTILDLGMTYRLFALRNKEILGKNIYCHFILEISK